MERAAEFNELDALTKLNFVRVRAEREKWAADVELAKDVTREERRQANLIELAKRKVAEILSESEGKARRAKTPVQTPQKSYPNTLICPHCRCKIGFDMKVSGRVFTCPNQRCRQPIKVLSRG